MRNFDVKTVPKKFVSDFEIVAAAYNLRELGEYEIAKNAARNDLDNAIVAFADIAVTVPEDAG